jgi:hypothetical protein
LDSETNEPPLNTSRDVTIWDETRDAIISEDLYERMNRAERRGLKFLLDCLVNSNACEVDSEGNIVTRFENDVEIVLDVERTIGKRISEYLLGRRASRSLAISVRSVRGTSHTLQPACVLSLADEEVPVTDDCAAFVLCAEDGDLVGITTIYSSLWKARQLAQQEEEECVRNVVYEEYERVLALSWSDLILEHEGFEKTRALRTLCADEIRGALLFPEASHHDVWTGELPPVMELVHRVLSRVPWELLELDQIERSNIGCARPKEGR